MMVTQETNNSSVEDLENKRFRRLLSLQNEINHLLDQIYGKRFSRGEKDMTSKPTYVPPIDIFESSKSYKVIVELPGLSPNDMDVKIENGFLEFNGTRKRKTENQIGNFIIRETKFGSFYRSFPLPDNVDIEKECKAKLADGILIIDLPKFARSKLKQRKILIKPDLGN